MGFRKQVAQPVLEEPLYIREALTLQGILRATLEV